MSFDVIIPTCSNISNKHFSLYFTIRSLLNQSLQPQNVIVVENLNYHETRFEIEKEFGKLVSVIDGTAKVNNISYSRNLGARFANSDLLIFMDDDVVLGYHTHFEKIVKNMNGLDFYCGAFRYWTKTDWPHYLDRFFPIAHIRHILRHKSFLPKSVDRLTGEPNFHEYSFIGHFGAIRRQCFSEVGGFDERFLSWSYQDTDLMMRLCHANFIYDLMCNDDIFIYHLSHAVDKSASRETNKALYDENQKNLGVNFHLNHFFGIFDDDNYAILTR